MKRAYITHITKEYLGIGMNWVKSIREFSDLPLLVFYVGKSPLETNPFSEFKDVEIRFIEMDTDKLASDHDFVGGETGGNFYVNRQSTKTYHVLCAKTIAMEMSLEEGWEEVCYLDSDCIGTPILDELFEWCNRIDDYPICTEGIHQYMILVEAGGFQRGNPFLNSWPEPDHKLCLEWPLMNFLEMSEWSRGNYRTTNLILLNQRCLEFIKTWRELCFLLPKLVDVKKYAPFHEETIYNVLSWKKTNVGFPLCYINLAEGLETVRHFYSDEAKPGDFTFDETGQNTDKNFFRIPESKRLIKVLHGEKRESEVNLILDHIKKLQATGYFNG